jgi:hypothetical protein
VLDVDAWGLVSVRCAMGIWSKRDSSCQRWAPSNPNKTIVLCVNRTHI